MGWGTNHSRPLPCIGISKNEKKALSETCLRYSWWYSWIPSDLRDVTVVDTLGLVYFRSLLNKLFWNNAAPCGTYNICGKQVVCILLRSCGRVGPSIGSSTLARERGKGRGDNLGSGSDHEIRGGRSPGYYVAPVATVSDGAVKIKKSSKGRPTLSPKAR